MIEPVTKEEIFDKTLVMVAERGFESVSIRDIAAAVGITSASIYHHYANKNKILEHFYEYYLQYHFSTRPSKEEVYEVIRTGTREQIVKAFTDASFTRMEPKQAKRMIYISKVVYTRLYFDAKAAAIYTETTREARAFIENALQYGVEIGRFKPFNNFGIAYTFVSLYNTMGIAAFAQPDYQPVKLEEETQIIQFMDDLLTVIEKE